MNFLTILELRDCLFISAKEPLAKFAAQRKNLR
jgi:hypothetical protein